MSNMSNMSNIKSNCPNYIICNNNIENITLGSICADCNLLFGKWRKKVGILKIKSEKEICPLCSNIDLSICRPDCEHYLCVQCFKILYFGTSFSKPLFPFPDKEIMYWINIENDIDAEWMKGIHIQEYLNKLTYWEKMSNIYTPSSSKCFDCCSEEA